jgi:hypothetical protein
MASTDFSPLLTELDCWSANGSTATFWWRDDDAVAPCAQLDRLLDIAEGRPLALATIPFYATAALAERLANEPHVTVFQHGWKHQDHAIERPNSEYPAGRPPETVARELNDGKTKLSELFGSQFAAVFTPPWHGLDANYLPLLRSIGLQGISLKGRRTAVTTAGLVQNNIHCVPIQWSDPPGFGDPAIYIGQLVAHLRQRRNGTDRGEATGILTHHLVQNNESLDFVRGVLDLISHHRAARLLNPIELFFAPQSGLSSVDFATVRKSPIRPSTIV